MSDPEGLPYPTGYESAVIGVASRWGEQFLVLDFEKVISITRELCDCGHGEALEFFYFNIEGSQMGEAYLIFSTIEKINEEGIPSI